MTKSVKMTSLAVLMAFALSACNTMSGMGEDIEAAGSSIEKTSEENKTY